jgi:hypothetical protein
MTWTGKYAPWEKLTASWWRSGAIRCLHSMEPEKFETETPYFTET